jgi:DNA-binding beta-propeller fold protein YncE
MHLPRLVVPSLAAASLCAPVLRAEDLGGGGTASHGRVPRLVLESWIPGQNSAYQFLDVPSGSPGGLVIISPWRTSIPLPPAGTLIADLTAPGSFVVLATPRLAVPIPPSIDGVTLYVQGLCFDFTLPGLAVLTDATRVDFFRPVAMVGNQRQTSNSLSVIDVTTHTVRQTLTNSENGYITYAPDRTRAYVCEPGAQRNRVVVYDLTQNPIAVMTTVAVPGGIRYGCATTRDGRRTYVPLHSSIAILDTDPGSPNYHTVLGSFPSRITGQQATILTGPFDLAVTPDGRKLYIAYGETLVYPAPSHVGVVDLTNPAFPETLIPVTTGGVLRLSQTPLTPGYATRNRIKMSADGNWVYVCETGANPAQIGAFLDGFQNGALIAAISTAADLEIASIATNGFYQHELAVDRMGRNLWVAQNSPSGIGEAIRIDVDRHSPTLWSVTQRIALDPVPFSGSAGGPRGIDVTPDGATVFVSVVEDGQHTPPKVVCVDALTNTVLPGSIAVGSLPATLSIQQF